MEYLLKICLKTLIFGQNWLFQRVSEISEKIWPFRKSYPDSEISAEISEISETDRPYADADQATLPSCMQKYVRTHNKRSVRAGYTGPHLLSSVPGCRYPCR